MRATEVAASGLVSFGRLGSRPNCCSGYDVFWCYHHQSYRCDEAIWKLVFANIADRGSEERLSRTLNALDAPSALKESIDSGSLQLRFCRVLIMSSSITRYWI